MKKYISLLLVLFLVSGCSFSFNMKNKEEVKEEKKEETSVNTVFYEAAQKIIVNDLLDMVSVGTCGVDSGFDFSNSNKLTVKELTDSYKYSMTYYNLYKDAEVNTLSKDEFVKAYEQLFESIPTLSNSIRIFPWYEYELVNGIYTSQPRGGGCMSRSYYMLDSYETNDYIISFNVIYYFITLDYNEKYSGDIISNGNIKENQTYNIELSGNEITESDLEKVKTNKDKFTQYRFNFKLNNDHYIFDSVEKIN